jgi:5-methyltetrahydrofolate--homocysteine methyltransferase
VFDGTRSDVGPAPDIPKMPFYGAKRWDRFDLFEIYKYVNPVALFRGQWGFKRPEGMGNVEFNAWLEEQARPVFERLQSELAKVFRPQVKWGYFSCASEGNDLVLFEEDGETERLRFTFPRQRDGRRLCLADFFTQTNSSAVSRSAFAESESQLPTANGSRPTANGLSDLAAFHLVTIGPGITEYERKLFANGDYQEYVFVHGMGVEVAEALAEYWHKQIRIEMGIAGDDPPDMKGLFGVKYRGCRYSFGYPACPNLEDQAKLFELLQPEDIGVSLSEEYMLEPEQSTSALICHHPEAKYFNVR